MGVGKLMILTEISVYLRNGRNRPWLLRNVNRNVIGSRQLAMSVPMTLSDIERQNARSHFFRVCKMTYYNFKPHSVT